MEYLKKEIIDLMRTLVIKLSMTSSSDIIKILSQELDSLTKAYMALEGKKMLHYRNGNLLNALRRLSLTK